MLHLMLVISFLKHCSDCISNQIYCRFNYNKMINYIGMTQEQSHRFGSCLLKAVS